MSFRLRMFLLFGGLAAVLLASEWFLVHSLTRDLSSEFGEVAASVGRDVIFGAVETHAVGFGLAGEPEDAASLRAWAMEHLHDDRSPDGESPGPGQEEIDLRVEVFDREDVVVVPGSRARWIQSETRRLEGPVGENGAVGRKMIKRLVYVESCDHAEAVDGETACVHAGSDTTDAVFNLRLDRAADAHFLFLTGPGAKTVSIPIPRLGVDDALDRTFNRLLLGSLGILTIGLLAGGFIAHRVTSPLGGLASAARAVGEGQLGAQARVTGGGEVSEAIRSFNSMSLRLQELDRAADEMRTREHLSELGEIARGLAHTLRNPLNALGLSVEELAARGSGPEASEQLVEAARRQIRRLDHAIRSFLALASEGAGHVEEVNILALVQDVVLEVLQDSRHRTPIKIETCEETLVVEGIAPELRAVVQALVVNAVEASPPGSEVRVRMGREAASGRVRLEIEDAGAGVPVEMRPRLFTPHTTTKATGSGMGLFLAHRIVTSRYAGSVDIQDREPHGSIARLELGHRRMPAGA